MKTELVRYSKNIQADLINYKLFLFVLETERQYEALKVKYRTAHKVISKCSGKINMQMPPHKHRLSYFCPYPLLYTLPGKIQLQFGLVK